MSDLVVRPLDESTWPDFVRLVEKHNGVWGGCWCMAFHQEESGVPSQPLKTGLRRSAVSAKAEHMPLWYTTVRLPSAGVSLGRRTNFHASSTSETI